MKWYSAGSDYLNMAGSRLGWERFYHAHSLLARQQQSDIKSCLRCGSAVLGVLFFNVAPALLFFLWTLSHF